MNKETERTYPYTGWVLRPSFKPVEVTLVKRYASYSSVDYGDQSESGKVYSRGEIHASKQDAIAAGWKRVEAAQADLDKRTETLRKKRAALNLASKP